MKYKAPLIFALSFCAVKVNALEITPQLLEAELTKSPPRITQIKATLLEAQVAQSKFEENFNSSFYANASYSKSREKSFSQFSPVVSPIKTVKLGVSKNLQKGFSLGAHAFSEQVSALPFTKDGTTSGVGVTLGIDLSKDFFGALSTQSANKFSLKKKRSEIEGKIAINSMVLGVHKLYWAIVANNEALKISKDLYLSSLKQAKAAKKRFKNRIADEGEVARYESQVALRSSNIVALKYERETLFQKIKELIPTISDQNLTLGKYNVDLAISGVMECTQVISKKNHTPFEYTEYDEVLSLFKQIEDAQVKIDNRYARPDIKLSASAEKLGKDLSFSDSVSDFSDNGKGRYSVALNINIPIGSSSRDTAKLQRKLNEYRSTANMQTIVAKLNAYHTQVVKEISLLQQVFKTQKINAQKLALTLKISMKKYKQARITVRELINDQDIYHQSLMSEIQTKYQVITTLLDYLSVFNKTPCQMNTALNK